MGSYSIEFKPSVHKDFRHLPRSVVERALRRIEELQENPFPPGVEKLEGAQHLYDFVWAIIVSCMRLIHEPGESQSYVFAIAEKYTERFNDSVGEQNRC